MTIEGNAKRFRDALLITVETRKAKLWILAVYTEALRWTAPLITNAANQTASKLQDKLNSSDYSKATDDELMDACKQFESYFLEQMFKEMMKTIPESEDTSSSNSQLMDYYKDEMVQQIASDSTEQNSLGLAQMLYEQMKRNYNLE